MMIILMVFFMTKLMEIELVMTSVELTKVNLDNINHPLVITNLITNGSAKDINQVYRVIDDYRLVIRDKLKDIANSINDGLDDYKCGMK